MSNFINLSSIKGFVSKTVPDFIRSIPSRFQGGREYVVITFRNATPLQQNIAIAALAVLALVVVLKVASLIFRAIASRKSSSSQLPPPPSQPSGMFSTTSSRVASGSSSHRSAAGFYESDEEEFDPGAVENSRYLPRSNSSLVINRSSSSLPSWR